MTTIRFVQEQDKDFWFRLDRHLSAEEFKKKIRDKMGYVIWEDTVPVGILRYNLFWDNTPFCTLLFVDETYRRKGYGKKLMARWEQDMKRLGYTMAMTSTQVNEDAQHFYRNMGYEDAGGLIIRMPKHEQPMEMFFTKELR